jgi:hypothetical protein
MLDAGRHEHERPGRSDCRHVTEEERHLAFEDVERIVLFGMHVCLEQASGSDLDDSEREARRVSGPCEELDVPYAMPLPGQHDDRLAVHGRHPLRAQHRDGATESRRRGLTQAVAIISVWRSAQSSA